MLHKYVGRSNNIEMSAELTDSVEKEIKELKAQKEMDEKDEQEAIEDNTIEGTDRDYQQDSEETFE